MARSQSRSTFNRTGDPIAVGEAGRNLTAVHRSLTCVRASLSRSGRGRLVNDSPRQEEARSAIFTSVAHVAVAMRRPRMRVRSL